MDMKTEKWFAQIQLSGVAIPETFEGNLIQILTKFGQTLKTTRARKLPTGTEIILMIRDEPFNSTKKESDSLTLKAQEVIAGLDDSNLLKGPNPGETKTQFISRLEQLGMSLISAQMIADECFESTEFANTSDLVHQWQSDSRVQRFIQLNSIPAEFEKALPAEYEELKHYVTHTYPSIAQTLTFRTA